MIVYLLKSAGCLALLLFFYHFVLEKEKMHNFNRFYLLGGVLFSFLTPLITLKTYVNTEITSTIETFETPLFIDSPAVSAIEEPTNYMFYAIILYGFISAIFFLRFGRNLYKIAKKIKTNAKVYHQKAILVLVEDTILPHTFWNYIFVNRKEYENNLIEEELFTHEITHAIQKHTFDVLIIEALQVVFWINPLFIYLKKAIQLNHEFLADETVINQHKNTFQYQHLLLNKAAWKNEYYLASNLNYSLTKKRLEMMTTKSSRTKILLKKLAVIPLITGFVLLFAERVEAQKKQETKPQIIEVKRSNGISKKEMKEYKMLIKSSEKTNIYKQKDVNRMQALYNKMSVEQQKSVINIKDIVPPPPPKMDIVFTYNRLANRVQRTHKNREANVIYLNELYSKMTAAQKKQVTKPSLILPPPPKPVKIKVVKKDTLSVAKNLTIHINKKGGLLVNNQVSSLKKLPLILNKLRSKKNINVHIKTDRNTKYSDVEKLKSILREHKLYHISINNKATKPHLVEVVVDEVKSHKKENIIVERVIEEKKSPEIIEVIEDEIIEVEESPKVEEVEIIEVVEEPEPQMNEIKASDFKRLKKEGYIFYLNGKKTPYRKIKKLDVKTIKKVDIRHIKNTKEIYITN